MQKADSEGKARIRRASPCLARDLQLQRLAIMSHQHQ
jgi:hypothetical protein